MWLKLSYFKTHINTPILLFILITYIYGLYGFYLAISGQSNWKTLVYHYMMGCFTLLGSLIGVHRYWSHKSFQPNKMIQIILMYFQTYSAEQSVYRWSRDHRVHHKYVDTDADPYNIHRGMFFAQLGYFAMKKTDEYKEKVKTVNLDDLNYDPLVMFQHRNYEILLLLEWSLSAAIPWYFWNESYFISACTLIMSYLDVSIRVGTVNSISHCWGWKPFDTHTEPTFSRLVTYLTLGEGYHNFHHTFPKDYTQNIYKWTEIMNVSALLIDFWDYMGWLSYKRVANPELVAQRRLRTGDMKVQIRIWSALIDYFIGFVVFAWSFWLISLIRYDVLRKIITYSLF